MAESNIPTRRLLDRAVFSVCSGIVMLHDNLDSDTFESGFELSLANEQTAHPVEQRRLIEAARRVLADSKFTSATVCIAVVDDATIHGLNRKFLNHDYATDVLSFVLEANESRLKGDVVLSADMAASVAAEGGWEAADEQLLYVVHGMLHLIGMDDRSDKEARRMRAAERYYLSEFGVELPQVSDEDGADSVAAAERMEGGGGEQAW